jgi:hypothetical protein
VTCQESRRREQAWYQLWYRVEKASDDPDLPITRLDGAVLSKQFEQVWSIRTLRVRSPFGVPMPPFFAVLEMFSAAPSQSTSRHSSAIASPTRRPASGVDGPEIYEVVHRRERE